MKKNLAGYFRDERNAVAREYLGADGRGNQRFGVNGQQMTYMSAGGPGNGGGNAGNPQQIPYMSGNGDYFGADVLQPMAPAPQPQFTNQTSEPISVLITNASAAPLRAILFGANSYLYAGGYTNDVNGGSNVTNFGNPTGISVVPNNTNLTGYAQILAYTIANPMFMGSVLIESVGATSLWSGQVNQNYTNINGDKFSQNLIIYADSYQQVNSQIQRAVDFMLDGNANWQFYVPANTAWNFNFFPKASLVNTRILGGGAAVAQYDAPIISPYLALLGARQ